MIQSLPSDMEDEYDDEQAQALSRLLVPLLSEIVDKLDAVEHRTSEIETAERRAKNAPGADGREAGG